MVKLDKISRFFGKKRIFTDLSFTLFDNEICGLVGLNGIGKTTLLRTIAGTLSVQSGIVTVFGKPPIQSGSFFRQLGIVLESDGFNGNLSFRDNIAFFARLRRITEYELSIYLDRYWQHLCVKAIPVKLFSRGERMQCGLARAFIGSPKLLLLDEPASNLDSDGYRLLCKLVSDAHQNGASAIISSHRLDTISELCSSVAFLSERGIQKITLSEMNLQNWVLRGTSLIRAVVLIEQFGGKITKMNSEEIFFKNIHRSDVSKLIPELIEAGVEISEIFLRDPVLSAMESSNGI